MENNIKKILDELYAIDPSLKQKEQELVKIVKLMIQSKPNIEVDENFKNNLKNQILNNIRQKKIQAYNNSGKTNFFHIFSYIFGTVGMLAFAFVIFDNNYKIQDPNHNNKGGTSTYISNFAGESGTSNLNTTSTNSTLKETNETSETQESNIISNETNPEVKNNIVKLTPNTGEKETNADTQDKTQKNTQLKEETPVQKSTPDTSPAPTRKSIPTPEDMDNSVNLDSLFSDIQSDSSSTSPSSSGMGGASFDSMSTSFKAVENEANYSFSGDLNLVLKDKTNKFKEDKAKNDFFENIKNIKFNGITLNSFQNLNVSNITLNEDKDYGYTLTLDFDNGNFNIYKNWNKWPNNSIQANSGNILNENEIKNISNDFLKKYNIDFSSYGTGELDKSYTEIINKKKENKLTQNEYIPQSVVITYPFILDGLKVYDENGNLRGIKVEVDLIEKKVISLSGVELKNYIKGEVESETKKENILKAANKAWNPSQGQKEEKALKNPELIYIIRKTNDLTEIVPGISFDTEEQNFTRKVLVPLLKEDYTYDNNGNLVGKK